MLSRSAAMAAFLLMAHFALMGQTAQPQAPQGAGLPSQRLGPDDLISIQVFNFPEFSRTVRVAKDGTIQLPLVKTPITAVSKFPIEIESAVADALRSQDLVVNPTVTVTVIEYSSRPISVLGAVKTPVTFQAIGRVTLMDAIIRAGGVQPEAGPEILVTRRTPEMDEKAPGFTQHISVRTLMSSENNEANILLTGHEEIRVPVAGRVYVLGDVKVPGSYPVQDLSDTTVLKALSLSGGVGGSASKEAYIIRRDEISGTKQQIPIELRALLDRRVPDYPLLPDDILYVPDNRKRRETLVILDRLATFGAAIGSGLVIVNAGR